MHAFRSTDPGLKKGMTESRQSAIFMCVCVRAEREGSVVPEHMTGSYQLTILCTVQTDGASDNEEHNIG